MVAGEIPAASAIFQGVMSAADGLAWNEEVGSATLPALTISNARVAQNTEHGASNAGDKGETPFASTSPNPPFNSTKVIL